MLRRAHLLFLLVARVVLGGEAVVPIVGHVRGANGSVWRSDVRLLDVTGVAPVGVLRFTPLGQTTSPADVTVPFHLTDGTLSIIDVYRMGFPIGEGVARLTIETTGETPVVEATTYNVLTDGGILGQATPAILPEAYHPRDSHLAGSSDTAAERTNVYLASGPFGASILWTYPTSDAHTHVAATDVPPLATVTHRLLDLLPGVAFGVPVTAHIMRGSARVSFSKVHNISNQPRWIDLPRVAGWPRITGIDYGCSGHTDHVPDVTDGAHQDGILRPVMNVGCDAPFPLRAWILVDPPHTPQRPYVYVGQDLPPGMYLNQGTGELIFDPPCTIAGSIYPFSVFASSNTGTTATITALVRVF